MTQAKKSLTEIVAGLRANGMRCNCDLDNWEPEANTGHSRVCRIHTSALNKFNDYSGSVYVEPPCALQ